MDLQTLQRIFKLSETYRSSKVLVKLQMERRAVGARVSHPARALIQVLRVPCSRNVPAARGAAGGYLTPVSSSALVPLL